MASTGEVWTSRVPGSAAIPRTPVLGFGVLTRRLLSAALAPRVFLLATPLRSKPGAGGAAARNRAHRGDFLFCLRTQESKSRSGWMGVGGRWGWGCCLAQGFSRPASLRPGIQPSDISGVLTPLQGGKQPAAPERPRAARPGQARGPGKERGPRWGEVLPEQTMKAGSSPRRALVLLKQSRSRSLLQDSTTSHRTGKWLPRSGLA